MSRVKIILFRDYTYTYTPEALALFAAMDVEPDDTRKLLIDTTILSLISAGLWDKMDLLYFTAAHDYQAGLLNWVSPSTFEMIRVNAPTFTTDRGYNGDGVTQYLRTQYNFNTDSVNYTQDSACAFVYTNTAGAVDGWLSGATNFSIAAGMVGNKMASGNAHCYLNDAAAVQYASSGLGLTLVNRVNSAGKELYLGGSLVATDGNTSGALPSLESYLLGSNGAGSLGSAKVDRVAAHGIGSGLTTTENTALYNIIQTYLIAVGGQA